MRQRHATEVKECDAQAAQLRSALEKQASRMEALERELVRTREACVHAEAKHAAATAESARHSRRAADLSKRLESANPYGGAAGRADASDTSVECGVAGGDL